MLDIPARIGIPVVLVVGVRLGCISHALLAASAIRARGLRLAGWIANRVDPSMCNADESVAAITDRLGRAPAADIAFAQSAPAHSQRWDSPARALRGAAEFAAKLPKRAPCLGPAVDPC